MSLYKKVKVNFFSKTSNKRTINYENDRGLEAFSSISILISQQSVVIIFKSIKATRDKTCHKTSLCPDSKEITIKEETPLTKFRHNTPLCIRMFLSSYPDLKRIH